MTMTATLQVVGNVIQNAPTTCVVTVANSSGATVNVNSVSPKLVPNGAPYILTQVVVPVGTAIPNATTGFQTKVPVSASGTAVFTFQVVPLGPMVGMGLPQQAAQNALVSADVLSDDGSYVSTGGVWVAPALPQFGQPPGSPPNASPGAFGGCLQFNRGTNSSLVF